MLHKIFLALGEIRVLFIFRREAGYQTQTVTEDRKKVTVAQKLLKKQVKEKKE